MDVFLNRSLKIDAFEKKANKEKGKRAICEKVKTVRASVRLLIFTQLSPLIWNGRDFSSFFFFATKSGNIF